MRWRTKGRREGTTGAPSALVNQNPRQEGPMQCEEKEGAITRARGKLRLREGSRSIDQQGQPEDHLTA